MKKLNINSLFKNKNKKKFKKIQNINFLKYIIYFLNEYMINKIKILNSYDYNICICFCNFTYSLLNLTLYILSIK